MFEADNIRDWRDRDVIDPEGHKIGQLEGVYFDTASDTPAFASVRVGMVGRRRLTFVPLERATVGPSYVRVAYPRKQVREAFQIDTNGELAAGNEPALFQHYGLAYQAGVNGERRLGRR
jgi:hypothetical protein